MGERMREQREKVVSRVGREKSEGERIREQRDKKPV